MQNFDTPDEQMLGAFVDGQLDPVNSEQVISAMDRDPRVREQVYQLRRAKDLMQLGFGTAMPPARQPAARRGWWQRHSFTIAASLATVAVAAGAWNLGYHYGPQRAGGSATQLAGTVQQQERRVVLHLSESSPAHFDAALDYVERFLQQEEGQGSRIEVIANAGGLDLMRESGSARAQKVRNMLQRHDNVHFVACANALRNLKEQGANSEMIDHVDTHHTAVDRIVERLQAGWQYVKVEPLTEL